MPIRRVAVPAKNNRMPGVSFADLKTKMTTGSESLGHAIHNLKPDANAKSEAKKAEKQANDDMASS